MTSKEHRKHSHITKPSYGNFSRNEWAIVGTHSSIIEELADALIKELSPTYKCAYAEVNDQHADYEHIISSRVLAGATIEYRNRGNHHLLNYNKEFNRFAFRQIFSEADMVIVNGNHLEAKAQVIVIDLNSKTLLQERLKLLNNVQLILLGDEEEEIFDFVREAIPGWDQLPVYRLDEVSKIIHFFMEQMKQAVPVVKGLVLAGGKSMRMGSDKGSIAWHGKAQRYYMADLLENFCDEVFISCRQDQRQDIDFIYKKIEDSFTELGPYGAILSAFREQPDCAWLVIACDMPLLESGTLRYLIDKRNPAAMATTFESPRDGVPEPLITIWEPKSYPILLSLLSQGYTCSKKALQSNDVCILKPPFPQALMNVNTPEEKEKAKKIIQDAG